MSLIEFFLFLCICFLYALIDYFIFKLYCKWKKKVNNGYRCYYWSCPDWRICPYNGDKRRFNIFK